MYTIIANAKADLQKIVDFSLDVICTINSENKFVTISASSKELFGYTPAELTGKDITDIVAEEDRESTLKGIQLLKENPSKKWCENSIVKKDGSVIHVAWTIFWDEQDELMYCVARSTDQKKKIEKILAETEEQIQFAQKLARLGSWYIDYQTNEVKWSDVIYDIYGLTKKGCPIPSLDSFFRLVPAEDRAEVEKELNHLMQSGKSDYTHRLFRPDGKTIYVRHISQAIKNEDGQLIALTGTVQDVTEQKEAEINLALSEQKFKLLVQNGSDIIVIIDEAGNFKYASPTTLSLVGFEPEELIGKNAFQMIHPDDVAFAKAKLEEIVACTSLVVPTQFRFINSKGEWIWLEALGNNLMNEDSIRGIVINARHIGERKKLEEQLAIEQKNRHRIITSAVIKAQESERSQLGQELHDNVNQVLTTVKLYNEMLHDGIGDPGDILEKSIRHLQSCINEIRSISKRLSAPTLGKITLKESIKELVESINLTRRSEINYHISGLEKKNIPQDFHLTIYRIVQEQLNNILKHAEARNVSIEIRNDASGFFLKIEDDGKGFDTEAKRKGIGITNMETRTENMHGRLDIISQPGKGCTLTATFPPIL